MARNRSARQPRGPAGAARTAGRPANSKFRRVRRTLLVAFFLFSAVVALVGSSGGDQPEVEANRADAPRQTPQAYVIPVSLPLVGEADRRFQQMVEQVLGQVPPQGPRPLLILEFRPTSGELAEASQFERALAVARFLTSDRLRRARTVAYVPQQLKGHAVLVAMACEQIVIAAEAPFGEAGVQESLVDDTMRLAYRDIANRRRTIPAPVALGMLDSQLTVYRVTTGEGVRYALEAELRELEQQGAVTAVETLTARGDLGLFPGHVMREHGFASHLAGNREQLAAALQLPLAAVESDPSLGGQWSPVQVRIEGPMSGQSAGWIERSLRGRLESGDVNFICLVVDSPGGSPADSVRLANFLAGLDPMKVRTVAYVGRQARADAALLALACDQLVMAEQALLGGPGAREFGAADLEDLNVAIEAIARQKQRPRSLFLAMVDPQLAVHRATHRASGEVRYYSAEERSALADADQWQVGERIETARGIPAREARRLGLASYVVGNFNELRQIYDLGRDFEPLEPNWAHLLIERLASPAFSGPLLFIAWFALMIEFMSPGVGLAGFVSGLCFLLFFWSNYLHGTAGWLEVLLFLGGVACVLLEIFVLPGLGIFGIGGGLMIVASIVLASQTFVVPLNAYQLGQLPQSLLVLTAGAAGAIVALLVMPRFLPRAPVLGHIVLPPPEESDQTSAKSAQQATALKALLNQRGLAVTRLAPAGKARFGEQIVNVVSDGELISEGTQVYVAEADEDRILVRPVER